jgi:predicted Zn-dependent protease
MERAYQRSPGNFRVRSNLASLYAEQGQGGRALEILADLTRDYPLYVNGWFNLALARLLAGDIDGAAEALSRAEALRGSTAGQKEQIMRLKGMIESSRNP